ncbi:LysM peptidoglycan-binding domain-containing protein [Paenibacillus abyssi]|nr:LysM peptidoglycan-binding domain-containing protein [Paenibacillus abyssi]
MFLVVDTLSFIFFTRIGDAAASELSAATVNTTSANVYTTPNSGSAVLTVLSRGEEYPVITAKAGDSSLIIHKVAAGQSLWSISSQYEVSISELKKRNKLSSSFLEIGQELSIPQKTGIHTVVKGDTLWKIAASLKMTTSDLMQINALKSTQLTIGQKLKIPDSFVQLQLLDGKKGWARKSNLQTRKLNRIIMGWNHGGNTQSNLKQSNKPNLNVISPRWYYINTDHNLTVQEDARFVKTAHNLGKRVWPLIGNRFDPELTDLFLSNPVKRQQAVSLLRDSLLRTDADGINVDFENIKMRNKQDFVDFIKELKAALKPHGLLISVDVTRTNEDPFWSGSLDRSELGKAADYIVMMGYEEHWGGSGKPGSVGSLPWVRQGLKELMREVPSHKIILGVPFFTREWVTNLATGKVSSYDRSMTEVEQIIKTKKLTKSWVKTVSQNLVRYTADGNKHEIWLEDKQSMKLRYDLVNQYRLRGIAAWYLGSETNDIWSVFN